MICGDRVTLRAITPEDYPRLVKFKNDIEFELLAGGPPPTPITLPMVSDQYDERVRDRSGATFAIEANGVFIGDCGLFNVDQRSGTAAVGIGIGDRGYWGKGYGREALGLVVDYGFTLLNLRKIWLETNGSNERAIHCYAAVGFVEEGRQREQVWSAGRYDDTVLMGLMRSDYTAARS